MLRDASPFREVWQLLRGDTAGSRGVRRIVEFLENRLGAEFVYNNEKIAFGRADLADIIEIAGKLRAVGVIRQYGTSGRMCDEPPLFRWYADYRIGEEWRAGGVSSENDSVACTKAVAEALERYLWFERVDYAISPRRATYKEIIASGPAINPETFAGYTREQREQSQSNQLLENSRFTWIRGYSWTQNRSIWIPAQVVSACPEFRSLYNSGEREPLIRERITTGLATHTSQILALLGGVCEIVERDAYIIMWLNHLSCPQINPIEVAKESPGLARLMTIVNRYRLRPYFIRMPTDAPAYAICVVLEDETGNIPRLTVGLSANTKFPEACEKALTEAIRARPRTRLQIKDDKTTDAAKDVGHHGRLAYWARNDQNEKLRFLLKGDVTSVPREPWDSETPEEAFERLLVWARSQQYEVASVPFTKSKANVTPWHVEMVVMPQMQPLYFNEKFPCIGGSRLRSVPHQLGYKTPSSFYLEEPHPFT